MKRKKTFLLSTGLVLTVAVVVGAVQLKPEHKHEEHAKFLVTSALRTDEVLTKQYVGQVRAIQHIEMRALERGYLHEIYVDEGQLVKKDQPMFQVMPMINEAEYNKAKAEAEVAKIEFLNTRKLAKDNVVSANELALAKAKYDKAKAARDLAKVHLDLTAIKAPFDGIMGRFHVRVGSLVEEGELLTTLSDNSKMWVYFNVSEAEYLDFRSHANDPGALDVQLEMANGKIFDQPGKVETIEADFNNETGNIAFRATFPNPEGLLRHGETGNIHVSVPLKNALVIPQKATFEVLDKKFVYVIDEKHQVQSREVKIAEELPHLYVLASGLTEGEHILFEGLGRVHPGDQIEISYLEPEKAIARLDVPAE